MKIFVTAKTHAKKESVQRVGQPTLDLHIENIGKRGESVPRKSELVQYKVSVTEAPVAGAANKAIIQALAGYFEVAPSCVTLVSGQTSKQKIFEILL